MRYMIINKADADSEAGKFPAPEVAEGVGKVVEDLSKAGVLLFAEGVHRSSLGARVKVEDGKRTVTDGPFAETKELIGGVIVVEVRNRDEAVEWAARLAEALGNEVEVRRVVEEADFAPARTSTPPELAYSAGGLPPEIPGGQPSSWGIAHRVGGLCAGRAGRVGARRGVG